MKPAMPSATVRVIVGAGVAAIATAAFLAGRAIAGGIPTGAGAMTYSGVLEDASGAPLTGTHNVLFSLWDSAQSGAGTSRCNVQNPTGGYDLGTTGRFTISLPDTCTAAVKSYPSLWVELTVDSTVLPRTKLGAVPYAVEAAHAGKADTATNATTVTVTSGTPLNFYRSTITANNQNTVRSPSSMGRLVAGEGQIPANATVVGVKYESGLQNGCEITTKINTVNAGVQRVIVDVSGFSDKSCGDVGVLTFSCTYVTP